MELHSIFADPVYISKLERNLTKGELRSVHKFKKLTLLLRSTSSYQKGSHLTSKDHYVLESKGLKNLKKDLNKIIMDYFDRVICPSNSITPYITQSWINWTEPNQFLHNHAHQNSLVSGVFYVAADKKVDTIKFLKDDYNTIMLEYKKFNLFNSSTWSFPVETGNIFLFPSHLIHGVIPKKGTNSRISLAFNVFIKGHIGSDEKIHQLKI